MCGSNGIFAHHPAAETPQERELLATRDAMRARPGRRGSLVERRPALWVRASPPGERHIESRLPCVGRPESRKAFLPLVTEAVSKRVGAAEDTAGAMRCNAFSRKLSSRWRFSIDRSERIRAEARPALAGHLTSGARI